MINDVYGFPFGRNMYGKALNLDIWSRQTNNMIVAGATGVGKTVLLKHVLMQQLFVDTRIIVLDMYREYKDMCESLGGVWLNGASDAVGCPSDVLSAKFVVIDLYDLENAPVASRDAVYVKVLSWCERRLTQSTDERALLFIDGYASFSNGAVSEYLLDLVSRVRMHNSGIILSVDSPEAFPLAFASASTYLVLMCLGGKRFAPLARMLGYPEMDVHFLCAGKRWTALLMAGSETEQIAIELAPEDKELLQSVKKRSLLSKLLGY